MSDGVELTPSRQRRERGICCAQMPLFDPNGYGRSDSIMAYFNDSDQGPLVDWNAGRLLPAPRVGRPKRREMFFPTRCANPDCCMIRWLTRNAAQKAEEERRICRKCQTSNAGKLG